MLPFLSLAARFRPQMVPVAYSYCHHLQHSALRAYKKITVSKGLSTVSAMGLENFGQRRICLGKPKIMNFA